MPAAQGVGRTSLILAILDAAILASPTPAHPQSTAREPLVVALTTIRNSQGAAPVSAMWFVVALGQGLDGARVVARTARGTARQSVSADQPSTWAVLGGSDRDAVIVALVRDDPAPPPTLESAALIIERAIGSCLTAGLPRETCFTEVRDAFRREIGAGGGMPPEDPRVVDVKEVRLSEGDRASARLGLAVAKDLDFQDGKGLYRVRLQFTDLARFKRLAPSP